MMRSEIPDTQPDEGNYETHPTATYTGTIALACCRKCGALVGDKARHDEWHDAEAWRARAGLLRLKRQRGEK